MDGNKKDRESGPFSFGKLICMEFIREMYLNRKWW